MTVSQSSNHGRAPVLAHATRLVLMIALAAFLMHVSAGQVSACSCAGLTPAEAFDRADAVFAGEVISIKVRGGLFGQSSVDPVTVEVKVHQVWKGPRQATLTIETVRSEASCGFEFEPGRQYLIYARDGETGLCDRTTEMDGTTEDIAALGAGWQPLDPTGSTPADPASRGGTCGAAQSRGNPRLDFAALGLLIAAAALGARPKRRL